MNAPTRPVSAPPGPTALTRELRGVLGGQHAGVRLLGREELGPAVHRLRFRVNGETRTLVVKRSESAMARRNWLVARRWLPALRLGDAGPPLLAVAAERGGEHEWQVYDDLGDRIIDESAPDRAGVRAVVALVARLHLAFADHPLLAECRLWGTDFGIHWYSSNVRDGIRALEGVRGRDAQLGTDGVAAREHLLDRLHRYRAEERERGAMLAEWGGPETLLHGDLWPKNCFAALTAEGVRARLVDWDRVGVGPVTYDISTFLSRFPADDREWILDSYREAVGRGGWTLPDAPRLNALFATAEIARLANRVIWPAIALLQRDADAEWAVAELVSMAGWMDALQPLLPDRTEGARCDS